MRFDIITLFPELFTPFLSSGINRRAFAAGENGAAPQVEVHLHNPRDFASGNYRRVDDRPFGGGPGMVMMAEPLAACIAKIQAERGIQAANAAWAAPKNEVPTEGAASESQAAPVILFSPIGDKLNHALVETWGNTKGANSQGAILLCGRYEGIDQRLIDSLVTHQISLGDFVLSGGEIAAIALLDAIARLQPGVLGDEQSHIQDSFNPSIGGLLDCPHYTRPEVWQGQSVPPVLLSGDHAKIEKWRQAQRLALTAKLRPELLPPLGEC
jgi:tRNA (guanine37-N1)-methyltransferase